MDKKKIQRISKGTVGKFPLHVYWEQHQKVTPFHNHDFMELVLICAGNGIHVLGQSRTPIRQGDVFVVSRRQAHAYEECSEDLQIVNFLFIPEQLPLPMLDAALMPGFKDLYLSDGDTPDSYPLFHLEENDFSIVRKLAEDLYCEIQEQKSGYLFNKLVIFANILGKLARIYSRGWKQNKNFRLKLSELIQYLNVHYKENISIKTLCSLSKMTPKTMRRNFIRMTGFPPVQYQIQLRISEACNLLRTTNKSISEIAYEVGFSDASYFGRQFKRITGKSSGDYRREYFISE